eukprot:8172878-Pyramimonas_sp.AAC.1
MNHLRRSVPYLGPPAGGGGSGRARVCAARCGHGRAHSVTRAGGATFTAVGRARRGKEGPAKEVPLVQDCSAN